MFAADGSKYKRRWTTDGIGHDTKEKRKRYGDKQPRARLSEFPVVMVVVFLEIKRMISNYPISYLLERPLVERETPPSTNFTRQSYVRPDLVTRRAGCYNLSPALRLWLGRFLRIGLDELVGQAPKVEHIPAAGRLANHDKNQKYQRQKNKIDNVQHCRSTKRRTTFLGKQGIFMSLKIIRELDQVP